MHKRVTFVIFFVLALSTIYIGCATNKTTAPDSNSDLLIVSNIQQEFTSAFGGPSPNQFVITITSSSNKRLNYTISKRSNWLQIINSNLSTTGFTNDSLVVSIRVSSPAILAHGTYYDTIVITTDSTLQEPIEKEIILHIGSEITSNPISFEFVANSNGSSPESKELEISSTSLIPFDVAISNNTSWLSLPITSYNTNDTSGISLSINTIGLGKGEFVDTIWVTSDSALNSPYPVPVTLQIKSWLNQISPRKNNLNDLYFADAQMGWAVGDIIDALTKSGFLIKTIDGGKNWEEVLFLSSTSSSDSILGGVTFVGNNGWTIGSNGIIMHSSDFGDNWEFQSPPANMKLDFNDLFFVSADSGWIVGDSGVILTTSNAGVTWSEQVSSLGQILTGVTFVDNMHGWISGLTDIILVTNDAGVTWTKQSVPPQNPGVGNKFDFKEILFVDSLNGFAVGKIGSFVSTIDGGTTWNFQKIDQEPGLLSLHFIDKFTGWITGQHGEVLQTTDGGATWTNQFLGITNSLQSVYFVDQNNGWVVGENGLIFYTASGGN